MPQRYHGSCHCGAIKFDFESEEISSGLRCSCSVCSRKGAMMNPEAIPPGGLNLEANENDVGLYQFGSKVAKHYFCNNCGIYTHNEMLRMPGHFRVNLGCIEELDSSDFEIRIFDGKNLL